MTDESAAYLQFLDQEVGFILSKTVSAIAHISFQAKKFSSIPDDDHEDLSEESLLETPLDKVEPYTMFKHVLMGMFFQLHFKPSPTLTGHYVSAFSVHVTNAF